MAKIICNDGTEEYLKPGDASAKVAAGEAKFPVDPYAGYGNTYSTRQMVAASPEKKVKRKRRTKAEMEADNDAADIEKLKASADED
jgi:hypothetical protein